MKELFNNLYNTYIRQAEPKRKIYNIIVSIETIAVAFIIMLESYMGYERDGVLILSVLLVYMICMLILGNVYPKKLNLLSGLLIVPVNFVVFPIMFLFTEGGGLKSGMPVWLAFGLLLVPIVVTEKKYQLILFPISLLFDAAVLIYGYYHGELFEEVIEESYYYRDNFIAIVSVSVSIGAILWFQKTVQKKQKQKLELAVLETEREKENAMKANKAKTDFIANISHDVRTPLNVIAGMTDLARYNIDDKEKVQDCLDKITESSMQLLHMINNILDMSEIETGYLHLNEKQFNIEELIDNIQVVLQQNAKSKKIDFKVSCNQLHQRNLVGDAVRLKQILMNLIKNSIKFTNPGGEILLKVAQVDNEMDNYAKFCFEIVDNGMGMSHEFIEHTLFQNHISGTELLTDNAGESGINMSIVKSIINAMGGTLNIDSEEGIGTKYIIYTSFKVDSSKVMKKEKDGYPILNAIGKNILIVEDNEINMEIMQGILERTHANIEGAVDAEEALERFSKSEGNYYDLIFMDIQLPGIDGYRAARTIRCMNREDALSVPIIAMTANVFAQDIEKALNSGMNAHISKPIDIDELFQKMYYWM